MFIKNILKGLLFGTFSMLPGLSGGMMASFTGDYIRCISIFVEKKFNVNNIMYLISILFGFIIGVVLISNILFYLFDQYKLVFKFIIIVINFLILISLVVKNKIKMNSLLITIILSTLILIILSNINFKINNIFISSFVYSFGKIFPGVSSTSILIKTGIYKTLLSFFSNPITEFFSNCVFWCSFWILFIIYSLLLVFILYFVLRKVNFDKTLILIQIINLLILLK